MNNPYTDVLCPHCGEFVNVIYGNECANCGETIGDDNGLDVDDYSDDFYNDDYESLFGNYDEDDDEDKIDETDDFGFIDDGYNFEEYDDDEYEGEYE